MILTCPPQRYVISTLCFLGLALSYVMRFCLGLAITEMVVPVHISKPNHYDPDACPYPNSTIMVNADKQVGEFNWSESTQGLILSSFFWGYVLTQVPGGILADKIGGKIVLGVGFAISTFGTLVTPLAARLGGPALFIIVRVIMGFGQKYPFDWTEHQQGLVSSSFFWGYIVTQVPGGMLAERIGPKPVLIVFIGATSVFCALTPPITIFFGYIGLIVIRIVLGLCQGFVYAALHLVVASWVPKNERGTLGTIVFSGSHAGNALNNLITGFLLYWLPGKWPIVFFFWSILGALWTVGFAFTTYGFPTDHDKMKPAEKELLDAYLKEVAKEKVTHSFPWKDVLKSRPVWALIIGQIGHDWGFYALVTVVPKYIKSVLHYNVKQNGLVNAAMFLTIWLIAILSGMFVDLLQRKEVLKTVNSRRMGTTIASVGPSLGLIGAAYSGCELKWALLSLCLGMGTMGFYYPSLKVNAVDLSSNFAGTIGSLGNAFGSLSGMIVPYLFGLLTPNNFLHEWIRVFWISFVVMTVTNLFYVIFASADLQPWNTPKPKEETEEK